MHAPPRLDAATALALEAAAIAAYDQYRREMGDHARDSRKAWHNIPHFDRETWRERTLKFVVDEYAFETMLR